MADISAWESLQECLEREVRGEKSLVSVVTWNPVNKTVTCYSRQIDPAQIFDRLNLSTGIPIRYRTKRQFKGCQRGYFVLFSEFEKDADYEWVVALVGPDIPPDNMRAIPFSL